MVLFCINGILKQVKKKHDEKTALKRAVQNLSELLLREIVKPQRKKDEEGRETPGDGATCRLLKVLKFGDVGYAEKSKAFR